MSKNHALSQARRWSRVRRYVFERDGYRCRHCGKTGALECDHIKPLEGSVRLTLLGRLSLSPFGDFRAQKQLLSGIDRTSTGDEAGSTTGKF